MVKATIAPPRDLLAQKNGICEVNSYAEDLGFTIVGWVRFWACLPEHTAVFDTEHTDIDMIGGREARMQSGREFAGRPHCRE